MRLLRSQYTLGETSPAGEGLLLNTLTGALDRVEPSVVSYVRANASIDERMTQVAGFTELVNRGYYVSSLADERLLAEGICKLKVAQARRASQPKYMFGVSLRCNLACNYCWQVIEHGNARQKQDLMSEGMVDAAFRYIDTDLAGSGRSAFISLFGGEPLMPTRAHRALVVNIGEQAATRGHHLHVTSNGRRLIDFAEILSEYGASVQVTVDGCIERNGSLTLLRAGQELTGLMECLKDIASGGRLRVFLRFLASVATVSQFAKLADFWFTDSSFSESGFSLAVAPIQDKTPGSDEISAKQDVLCVLISALADRDYGHCIEYVDWRSLALMLPLRNNPEQMMEACFYHCEANIALTAFGNDGRLYCCYEGIGNADYAVGCYWPSLSVDVAHLSKYRDRNAFAIEQCSNCSLSPFCGGGCEVRGRKHSGSYLNSYCDGLHAETAWLLQNWTTVSSVVLGASK